VIRKLLLLTIIFSITTFFLSETFPEEGKVPIIVDGDEVEFFSDTKEMMAEGNVVITYQDTILTCDKVRVNTQTKDTLAEGNVHLVSKKGEIRGERVEYNFEKGQGRIIDGHFKAEPFYGKSEVIDRKSEREFVARRGYFTTCDLDEPHYRMQARRIEMYPGDKVVAKDVLFKIGSIPLFYLPKYVKRLDEKRPRVRMVPGKDKEWGYFLLQAWRYDFNELIQGRLHLDYREKRDFAWGFDNHFNTPLLGEGLLRTYYMNERKLQTEHIYDDPKVAPTIEKERFRIRLMQTKEFDESTSMVLQFNRISDDTFIKDYFYREYEKDYNPDSFLLLTQAKPYHSLSLLVRKRFNRYFAETERLPEFKLEIPSYRLGDFNDYDAENNYTEKGLGNFYYTVEASTGILENKGAAPSDLKQKIFRLDTYNKLSYQRKVAFIKTNPYIAFRETLFSRDANRKEGIWRQVFYAGIDLSTKFYRMFNVQHESLLVNYHNLRHVITPTLSYEYIRKPNITAANLIEYDAIDTISKKSNITLSLENKLQTKRENKSVDFLRFIVDTSYIFRYQQEAGGNFSNINYDLEFLPTDWIRIDIDSVYDRGIKKFSTVNFDINFHDKDDSDRWSVGIGKRYSRKNSNQMTMEVGFRPNKKWKFRIYERFYPHVSSWIEQGYTVTRDLHCWEIEVNYNIRRGWGETLFFIFRIKAFPEMEFDWNKEYHRRKPGSQQKEE